MIRVNFSVDSFQDLKASLEEDGQEAVVTWVTFQVRHTENDLNDAVNLLESGAEALWRRLITGEAEDGDWPVHASPRV